MLRLQNRDIRDLALASLGHAVESELKARALTEALSQPKNRWYRCEFRNCDLLLVHGGRQSVLEKEEMHWLLPEGESTALRELVRLAALPFFTMVPRVIVLRTPPGQKLHWHVDCNAAEVPEFQPKLRVLLRGQPDDLYFMSSTGGKVRARTEGDIYYMSGAYIHALENRSSEERYVLCFGSPWNASHVRKELITELSSRPADHLLWNDELRLEGREQFIREPKKHPLVQYA